MRIQVLDEYVLTLEKRLDEKIQELEKRLRSLEMVKIISNPVDFKESNGQMMKRKRGAKDENISN